MKNAEMMQNKLKKANSSILMFVLFALYLTLTTSHLTPLSECNTAGVTYYTGYGAESVACHLGTQNLDTMFRAASSEQFYLSSQQCGICYEAVGEKGSIRFMVTDLCPASENKEWCASSTTHFDLAENAFPYICDTVVGHCNITYRMVACDVEGNVALFTKEGVSDSWIAFYVRNYVVGLKSVSIAFGTTKQSLTRNPDNYWEYQAPHGTLIKTPITVTLTSIAGDTATITMNDIAQSKLYNGNNQFEVPQNTFFKPETLAILTPPTPYDECCSLPNNTVVFDDAFRSFWKLLNGGSVSIVKDVQLSGTSSLKALLSNWGNFKITTDLHSIPISVYDTIHLYIKSSSQSDIQIWAEGKTSDVAKQFTITSEWKLFAIKLADIGSDSYFNGFEVQIKSSSSSTFYFDDIRLIQKDGSCDQYCSDHTSTCSLINPSIPVDSSSLDSKDNSQDKSESSNQVNNGSSSDSSNQDINENSGQNSNESSGDKDTNEDKSESSNSGNPSVEESSSQDNKESNNKSNDETDEESSQSNIPFIISIIILIAFMI